MKPKPSLRRRIKQYYETSLYWHCLLRNMSEPNSEFNRRERKGTRRLVKKTLAFLLHPLRLFFLPESTGSQSQDRSTYLSSPEPFIKSDSAISAVISAVMILGLIVTATTMYQVRYVPAWKGDAEYSHMIDVCEGMSNLKSQVDVLSAILAANPWSRVSVSIPIKMGGGDIPVIGSGRSSGTLSVNDNDCGMWIDANNATGMLPYSSDVNLTDLGSISYRSCNNYYLNQRFEYENGALILVQEDRSLMKLAPAITLQKLGGTDISVAVSAIEITGDKRSISSNAVEEVRLTSDSRTSLLSGGPPFSYVNITVFTEYPDAWAQYFNRTADGAGLNSSEYAVDVSGTSVKFLLVGEAGVDDITLSVRKSVVEARLDVI